MYYVVALTQPNTSQDNPNTLPALALGCEPTLKCLSNRPKYNLYLSQLFNLCLIPYR